MSVDIQLEDVKEADILVDTTVQEKNITIPTDGKLYDCIIRKTLKIAEKEGIKLRQSYRRTTRRLKIRLRFSHHPKRRKEARAAQRKLTTIAGRLTREIERKLPAERLSIYLPDIVLFNKVLLQRKTDKNKIYSLHEPHTSCIAKGKSHKEYEFGSKVSCAVIPGENIIAGVVNFQ